MKRPFVDRQARLFEYSMGSDERGLYEEVTRYLLEPDLCAFRGGQRRLLLLGFHRRMASSLEALAASLQTVVERLQGMLLPAVGSGRRRDDQTLTSGLLHVAFQAILRRPITRAGRRVCRGGRFGRGRPAPQSHRRPPSFRERISSIEAAAFWPSPTGPEVAGS